MRKRYTVVGSEANMSRTGLQREWSQRLKKYRGTGRKRVTNEADRRWFVDVARLFDKQREKLYPNGSDADTDECHAMTEVFVDKGGLGFGNYHGKKSGHAHKTRCVYFQHATQPFKFRAVSAALADKDEVRDERLYITEWLRKEIDYQIKEFRKAHRGGRCYLCHKSLHGKLSHVDHGVDRDSFKCIAADFQRPEGVKVKREEEEEEQKPKAKPLGRALTLDDTKDQPTARVWKAFHRSRANLTLTCSKCNLKNK
jgi:hypothetical protein